MSLYGSLIIRLREKTNPWLAPLRRMRMNCPIPIIISNNCWAGHVYRYYGWLPYPTPTVGLYFFADDYIRFLQRLEYYLQQPIRFITWQQSKYADTLKQRGETEVPIGMLDDVEIVFLHYHSQQEVLQKWERRKSRMDLRHIVVKLSEMNGCTYAHLKAFDALPFEHKFVFTKKPHPELHSAVYYKGYENSQQIDNDTTYFRRGINLRRFFLKMRE